MSYIQNWFMEFHLALHIVQFMYSIIKSCFRWKEFFCVFWCSHLSLIRWLQGGRECFPPMTYFLPLMFWTFGAKVVEYWIISSLQICKDDEGQSEFPAQKQIHKLSPSTQYSTSTHSTYRHTSKRSSGKEEETTVIRVEPRPTG